MELVPPGQTAPGGVQTAPGPTSGSVPTASNGGSLPVVHGPGASTEEQRRRWRDKGKARRARARSGAPDRAPVAAPGAALPAAAQTASVVLPGAGAPIPIPWNPERLRKLWEQLVPATERWDVGSLKEKARAVDECLVEMVEKEAPWNPISKTTLVETGPQVTAEILNALGIGADRADVAGFVIAAVCIYTSRALVVEKLDKMGKEKVEREKGGKVGRGESGKVGEQSHESN